LVSHFIRYALTSSLPRTSATRRPSSGQPQQTVNERASDPKWGELPRSLEMRQAEELFFVFQVDVVLNSIG
ncbi:hypothetical protein RB213_003479, partial [Colletotrichum asianum]